MEAQVCKNKSRIADGLKDFILHQIIVIYTSKQTDDIKNVNFL